MIQPDRGQEWSYRHAPRKVDTGNDNFFQNLLSLAKASAPLPNFTLLFYGYDICRCCQLAKFRARTRVPVVEVFGPNKLISGTFSSSHRRVAAVWQKTLVRAGAVGQRPWLITTIACTSSASRVRSSVSQQAEFSTKPAFVEEEIDLGCQHVSGTTSKPCHWRGRRR